VRYGDLLWSPSEWHTNAVVEDAGSDEAYNIAVFITLRLECTHTSIIPIINVL